MKELLSALANVKKARYQRQLQIHSLNQSILIFSLIEQVDPLLEKYGLYYSTY
jgi:hypothetical protein